jgi:hypothetical protein
LQTFVAPLYIGKKHQFAVANSQFAIVAYYSIFYIIIYLENFQAFDKICAKHNVLTKCRKRKYNLEKTIPSATVD